MAGKVKASKKVAPSRKAVAKAAPKKKLPEKKPPAIAAVPPSPVKPAVPPAPPRKAISPARKEALYQMLMGKRREVLREIFTSVGSSLTEEQQRRLESAMDVGDQSLMDLQRELGISLMEMRNRRRQSIDDALIRLGEGTYGLCADCGVEISEKRLEAVPFAKLCLECQSKQELLEKIEKGEERD